MTHPLPDQPTPDGPPDAQRMYWDLLTRYNQLYGGLRVLLKGQHRIDPNAVLSEDDMLAEVGAVFRDADRSMADQVLAREADQAERERWQRHETRWRALSMAREGGLHGTAGHRSVDTWIASAQKLARAVESDDFTA